MDKATIDRSAVSIGASVVRAVGAPECESGNSHAERPMNWQRGSLYSTICVIASHLCYTRLAPVNKMQLQQQQINNGHLTA